MTDLITASDQVKWALDTTDFVIERLAYGAPSSAKPPELISHTRTVPKAPLALYCGTYTVAASSVARAPTVGLLCAACFHRDAFFELRQFTIYNVELNSIQQSTRFARQCLEDATRYSPAGALQGLSPACATQKILHDSLHITGHSILAGYFLRPSWVW